VPPEPVFFIDRNLGAKYLPAELRKAGFCLVVHDEHFKQRQDVQDPEVIAECGRNGWILLTADSAMSRRWAVEIKAAKIGIICQTNNNQGPRLWVPRIIRAKNRIIKAALNREKPFVDFIQAVPNGKLVKGALD
jgi:predicted nuclease of predicted toxin-antitoxin system